MGKTTVSDHLANVHHVPVLDADLYAREAVEPGSTVLTEVVERYGSHILLSDGTLDRRRLGDVVFNSPAERLWLEQRIHPFVRDRMEAELHRLAASHHTVALVIPLLFEARMTDLVTEIWVVQSQADQQRERLMQRDHLNLEQIQVRIDSQMAIEKKVAQADVVIDNSSTLEALARQVDLALGLPGRSFI
ncbi:dephospho-CoA kinase [filamentous cyanobacterium CCP1]|nr:dephospho-CoA kinase [filamentous cyanobacterium CCP2]PSB60154.1 dephospho-CoA kinase [filamentous cyanobacterium CCP1]